MLPHSHELISLQSKVKQLSLDEAQSLLIQSVLRILKLEEHLRDREKEREQLNSEIDQEKGNVDVLRQSLSQLQFDGQRKLDRSRKVSCNNKTPDTAAPCHNEKCMI